MQCSTIFVFAFFSTFIIIFLSVILIGIFNWSHFDQFAIDTRNELVPIKSLNLPPVRDHKTITYRNKFRSALSSYNVEQWNINLVAAVLSYEKNMHAFWNKDVISCEHHYCHTRRQAIREYFVSFNQSPLADVRSWSMLQQKSKPTSRPPFPRRPIPERFDTFTQSSCNLILPINLRIDLFRTD